MRALAINRPASRRHIRVANLSDDWNPVLLLTPHLRDYTFTKPYKTVLQKYIK